jgi:hypothetical protein
MKFARWRLRAVLIVIASLAVFCAGAVKWRRYVLLRDRIASYSRQEQALLDEYQLMSRLPRSTCGNARLQAEAFRAVATKRRRQIEECEREIWRIW